MVWCPGRNRRLAGDPALSAEQATCLAKFYLESEVFPEAPFSTVPDEDLNARVHAELAAAFESCAYRLSMTDPTA